VIDYADLTSLPGGVFAEVMGLDPSGAKVFEYRYPTTVCDTAFNSIPIHFESLVFPATAAAAETIPPSVSVTASPASINEGGMATFIITASNSHPLQAITINYSISGARREAQDFAVSGPSGQVVLPPGVTSATVTLQAGADAVSRKKQKVKLTLKAGSNYRVSKPKNASVTILNVP